LAVRNKKVHDHPLELEYVYKLSFLCEITGGLLAHGHETLTAEFFVLENLPELSLPRNTASQIQQLYKLASTSDLSTEFD
jgi:ADP-ribose pyrophosphatase YjhB (NUDIX family)